MKNMVEKMRLRRELATLNGEFKKLADQFVQVASPRLPEDERIQRWDAAEQQYTEFTFKLNILLWKLDNLGILEFEFQMKQRMEKMVSAIEDIRRLCANEAGILLQENN